MAQSRMTRTNLYKARYEGPRVIIAVCRKVCHGRFDTKLMAGESLGIVQGISRANLGLNSREIYQ